MITSTTTCQEVWEQMTHPAAAEEDRSIFQLPAAKVFGLPAEGFGKQSLNMESIKPSKMVKSNIYNV